MKRNEITVKGNLLDNETRCIHYHSPLDIIAIKFHCCNDYYPCYECHAENTDHVPSTWPKNLWDSKAILCGGCKKELTIREYLNCNDNCPYCGRSFNPRCATHYHLYFEI